MKTIHVATVPAQLDLAVLDRVLSGLESAVLQMGAGRVWIAPDGSGLAVMAELPVTATSSTGSTESPEATSC